MEKDPLSASPSSGLDELCINTIRFLAIDAVQKANSGHPGMPMGAAPMACVLWTRHLRHNPANPSWFNRDRFVLSAGHGSMLLYSLLHLTGYDLSLDEIKQVVSMPSWELFDEQPKAYRDSVIPPQVRARLAIEAGSPQGWHRYVGDGGEVLGVEWFGASAPGEVMLREYGFTMENVCRQAIALLARVKGGT